MLAFLNSNGYVSVSVALATLEAVSLGFWGSKTSACLPLEIDSLFLTELKIIGWHFICLQIRRSA